MHPISEREIQSSYPKNSFRKNVKKKKKFLKKKMQSINFNITTDFNAVRKSTWPRPSRLSNGLGYGHGDFQRKQRLNCRHDNDYSSRSCRIVACASESQSPGGSNPGSVRGSGPGPGSSQSSFLSPGQTYALLKQQMEVAAKSEVS